jgi:hypothetical protein
MFFHVEKSIAHILPYTGESIVHIRNHNPTIKHNYLLSSLPSVQLVQFTHLFAFSLIYFLQNLHLTCFLTILSSVPLEYANAITHNEIAMHKNRTTLSRKLPYANTTAPSSSACLTVL